MSVGDSLWTAVLAGLDGVATSELRETERRARAKHGGIPVSLRRFTREASATWSLSTLLNTDAEEVSFTIVADRFPGIRVEADLWLGTDDVLGFECELNDAGDVAECVRDLREFVRNAQPKYLELVEKLKAEG